MAPGPTNYNTRRTNLVFLTMPRLRQNEGVRKLASLPKVHDHYGVGAPDGNSSLQGSGISGEICCGSQGADRKQPKSGVANEQAGAAKQGPPPC